VRFDPNPDQTALFSVLEQMMAAPEAAWRTSPDWSRHVWSGELDALIESNGFLDCALEQTLGLSAAAAMTYRLATLPVLVECAASSMLRPQWASELPRPIAVLEQARNHVAPFLPVARSVIFLGGDAIEAAILDAGDVETVDSLYAYPMGRLRDGAEIGWRLLGSDVESARRIWRVALAAELAGVLKGGLECVVAHVSQRHQFGRPLGAFQAIQHRLAGAAVKIDAAYWLALRAAQTLDAADAATALGYIQEASTRVIFDLHQFMGAMGLTLEHPLHRWTYRARLLRASMGGGASNMRQLFAQRWAAA
jgi:hypothetical protein